MTDRSSSAARQPVASERRRGRAWLRRASLAVSVVLALAVVALGQRFHQQSHVPLYAAGVVVDPTGHVDDAPAGTRYLSHTRVAARGSPAAARAQQEWLAAGMVPLVPELGGSDLLESALLDLHTLATGYDAPVAGLAPAWRYVWPRDAAFAAVALTRTGHAGDADRILSFLQRVQGTDGLFQARYLPDGSGVPDGRRVQRDGTGWSLWALADLAAHAGPADRGALIRGHLTLLRRGTDALLGGTGDGTHLAPAGPDYWEVADSQSTLATNAVLLTGLRAASSLWAAHGDTQRASTTSVAAERLTGLILAEFGPDFPRHAGGRASSVDLGATFLMAPFAAVNDGSVARAWRGSAARMGRPAGGLAPGGSWRGDGISWTPTTATWAMAAACVDRRAAVRRLQWLDQHRTSLGALPEKVLSDGSPASVAPLAWTAAAVLVTATELEDGCASRSPT